MSGTGNDGTQITWRVPGGVSPGARDALAGALECQFTDESRPRPTLSVAPGVSIVVEPGPDAFRVVATVHDAVPPTDLDWLDGWVRQALGIAGLPEPDTVERSHA